MFRYLEVLASDFENESIPDKENQGMDQSVAYKLSVTSKEEITKIIQKIVTDTSEEDGWAFLGMVGNVLNKQKPDFDSRNYGYQKLTQFVQSLDCFDIEHRPTNNPGIKHTYIRAQAAPNPPRRRQTSAASSAASRK